MFAFLRRLSSKLIKVLLVGTLIAAATPSGDDATAPICVPSHLPPIRTKVQSTESKALFAPYVECWADRDLSNLPGHALTLAFLLSRGGKASWDGTMPLEHWLPRTRASRKTIVLSFGGASGTELALDVKDPKALAAQYVKAARTYGAARLDFDIEGWSTADAASVSRRNQALRLVQDELPGVELQYTLPVMPHGLDAGCLAILKDAKAKGVKLHAVNVMAMNYGDSYRGDMGKYAIQAARATREQLKALGLAGTGVGITPMVMENDVKANVFTLEDARQVADFAAATPWVKFVGFWSAGRDKKQEFGRVFASKLAAYG